MSKTATRQAPADSLGLAALTRMIYERRDIAPLVAALVERAAAAPPDAGAMLDLSVLLQLTGDRAGGLALQAQALGLTRLFRTVHGSGRALSVLALLTPGDFMANTPLDFLLEGSDGAVTWLYADPDAADPAPEAIPEHDVAIFAVGESPEAASLLARLGGVAEAWPRPMLNARPDRIACLTRDGVSAMFVGEERVLAPETRRWTADQARAAADGAAPGLGYPMIIRPAGTHAGHGLEKADSAAALGDYLDRAGAAEFYAAPFVDYSGPDGLYRKQRIVFVDGAPFISHMAVSEHWMVHYLSAGMAENADRRAEEAAFMASFDREFAVRHREAFALLCKRIGLDYFGIDCAETRDGRLLVFEVDVAMIVHALDDASLFPYKVEPMRRLSRAFIAALEARARLSSGRCAPAAGG